MGYSLVSPLFPSLGEKDHLSEELLGWIISAYSIAGTILTPFIPQLIKKFSRIKLLCISAFLEARRQPRTLLLRHPAFPRLQQQRHLPLPFRRLTLDSHRQPRRQRQWPRLLGLPALRLPRRQHPLLRLQPQRWTRRYRHLALPPQSRRLMGAPRQSRLRCQYTRQREVPLHPCRRPHPLFRL